MSRPAVILTVALAAQLVLAAGTWTWRGSPGSDGSTALVPYQADAVMRLTIADGDDRLQIERGEDGWRLPGSDGFPARTARADGLVRDLADVRPDVPVARSQSARERLRVADQAYERKVSLEIAGGEAVEVLLGSSAGAGRVYARRADAAAIYEADIELWRAETDPAEWYDTGVAGMDPASVQRAELPELTLTRAESGWSLADGDGAVDAGRAAEVIAKLSRPDVESISRGEPPAGEATFTYRLEGADGERETFRYYLAAGEGKAKPLLLRDGQPWRYRVSAPQLDELRELSPAHVRPQTCEDGDNSNDRSGAQAREPAKERADTTQEATRSAPPERQPPAPSS